MYKTKTIRWSQVEDFVHRIPLIIIDKGNNYNVRDQHSLSYYINKLSC